MHRVVSLLSFNLVHLLEERGLVFPIQLLLVHPPTKGGIDGALSAQVINIRLDVWAPCRALHAFYMQQGLRASPPKGQCEILAACGRSDICALLSCNEKAFFLMG